MCPERIIGGGGSKGEIPLTESSIVGTSSIGSCDFHMDV